MGHLIICALLLQLGRADLNSKLNNGGAVASLVHALNQAVSSVFLPDVQSTVRLSLIPLPSYLITEIQLNTAMFVPILKL